jgi:hypothetical protein
MKQTRLVSRGENNGEFPGGATSCSVFMYTQVSNRLKNGTRVQSYLIARASKPVGISVAAEAFFSFKQNSAHWSELVYCLRSYQWGL